MNPFKPGLALALLFAAAPRVQAVPVIVGNLAPTTAQDTVSVTVDDKAAAVRLPYREFVTFDAGFGTHRVRVDHIRPGGTELLVETQITIEARTGQIPTLVIAGNGVEQPYSVQVFQDPGDIQRGVDWLVNTIASVHHLAPYPGSSTAAQAVETSLERRELSRTGGSGVRNAASLLYGDSRQWAASNQDQLGSYLAQFRGEFFGGLELDIPERDDATLRVFLIGDDRGAPVEMLGVMDGEVVAISEIGVGVPSSILNSPSFWFDRDRLTQGISVFEQRATGSLYGTWYTFAADGHPVWYSLDGVASPELGRRDVSIREISLVRGVPVAAAVGSAVLQYSDCNNAELRVLIGSSDVRTLRLQRSRPVSACAALDR